MLERAKACLTSGARDSLRCTQSAPRSRRLLHSTFWSHGAGDLELPAHAITYPLTNSHHPPPSDNRRRRRVGAGKSGRESQNTPSDGVFLDFLYPPQALAWLHGASSGGKQRERWEGRNVQRLPDGFAQVTRRYASTSQKATPNASVDPIIEEHNDDPESRSQNADIETEEDILKEMQEETAMAGHKRGYVDDAVEDRIAADLEEMTTDGIGDLPTDLDGILPNKTNISLIDEVVGAGPEDSIGTGENESDENETGEKTTDLGVVLPSDTNVILEEEDPVASLKFLISTTRGRLKKSIQTDGGDLAQRAWKLYDNITRGEEADTKLKLELFSWLSLIHDDEKYDDFIALYHSIPVYSRTASVYDVALSAYLRGGLLSKSSRDGALTLYIEAIARVRSKQSQILSAKLLAYAVEQADWPLMCWIHEQRSTKLSDVSRNSKFGVFDHLLLYRILRTLIGDVPNLIGKTHSLLQYLSSDEGRQKLQAQTQDPRMLRLCSAFVSLALNQEFAFKDPQKLPTNFPRSNAYLLSPNVRQVINKVQSLGRPAIQIYQDQLKTLLRRDSPHLDVYSQSAISVLFTNLRVLQNDTYRIPQPIFMALIRHLCKGNTGFSTKNKIDDVLLYWTKAHGKPTQRGLERAIRFYAYQGANHMVTRLFNTLKHHYPEFVDHRSALWMLIYVHLTRGDYSKAKATFLAVKSLYAEHGELPNLRCWNVLLTVQSRADDLEGALRTFMELVNAGIVPDVYTVHPVLEMLARRGDHARIRELLQQYDILSKGSPRRTPMAGSLMTAYTRCGETGKAKVILRETVAALQEGKIFGRLTECFNIVLTGFAMERDADEAMATYRWMKTAQVPVDADTYAALMQVLCFYRVPDQAYTMLTQAMAETNTTPKAFNYAIVMNGFYSMGMPEKALKAHDHMRKNGVRPSVESNTAYLRAKAAIESREYLSPRDDSKRPRLDETIAVLDKLLLLHSSWDLGRMHRASARNRFSTSPMPQTAYFVDLIRIHGKRQCHDAVEEIFHRHRQETARLGVVGGDNPPFDLIGAMMTAHLRTQDYEEIERCWKLAKKQADDMMRPVPLPEITPENLLEIPPSEPEGSKEEPSKQSATEAIDEGLPRTPDAGRAYILSNPMAAYMESLSRQSRELEMVSLLFALTKQGYKFENRIWNSMVYILLRSSTPYVLLAFVIVERFLIDSFPGWERSRIKRRFPSPAASAQSRQYMRRGSTNISPTQMLPLYPTLVHLGAGLLELRRLDTVSSSSTNPDLLRYVGNVNEVRKRAPKTLRVVHTMPTQEDTLQNRVLGRLSS